MMLECSNRPFFGCQNVHQCKIDIPTFEWDNAQGPTTMSILRIRYNLCILAEGMVFHFNLVQICIIIIPLLVIFVPFFATFRP